MAVTSKLFTSVAATTTTSTVLYTVSSTSATAVVTNIVVNNSSSAAATFTMSAANAGATQIPLFSTTAIPANTTVAIDLKRVLPATNPALTIQGGASTTAVYLHVSGVEIV
jgi:hypothetical protein